MQFKYVILLKSREGCLNLPLKSAVFSFPLGCNVLASCWSLYGTLVYLFSLLRLFFWNSCFINFAELRNGLKPNLKHFFTACFKRALCWNIGLVCLFYALIIFMYSRYFCEGRNYGNLLISSLVLLYSAARSLFTIKKLTLEQTLRRSVKSWQYYRETNSVWTPNLLRHESALTLNFVIQSGMLLGLPKDWTTFTFFRCWGANMKKKKKNMELTLHTV